MKLITTLSLLLSIGHFCNGQVKELSIPTYNDGQKTFWYKYQQDNFQNAKLKNLLTTVDTLHFRLSTQHQAIDIWTNDFNIFYGTLANFTTNHDPEKYKKNNPKPDKFFSIKLPIDTLTAKRIYNLFKEKSIFDIPTRDKIKGWNLGTDGEEFIIEYSTKTTYSFKEYWTPSIHKDKLNEAMLIDNLTKEISIILQLRQAFDTFINSLPYGCYHSGSMIIVCRTKNKSRK